MGGVDPLSPPPLWILTWLSLLQKNLGMLLYQWLSVHLVQLVASPVDNLTFNDCEVGHNFDPRSGHMLL